MEPAVQSNNPNQYLEYKDNPSGLFKIAIDQTNKKHYEEALEILETAINYAKEKYGSEKDINLAIYYTRYAECLIRKLLESDELLVLPEGIENDVSNENNEAQTNEANNANPQNEEATDEEIILGNLLSANSIYIEYLTPYDREKDITKLDPKIIGFYKELSFNYLMFGDYEKAKSDFPKAVEYYLKAIDIRTKYDSIYSRDLAELYYNLAFVYDADPKKCLLSYFKVKTIMEYHLSIELKKHNCKQEITVSPDYLKINEISETDPRLFINKTVVESDEVKSLREKDEEVDNFCDILNSLYIKLEDSALECAQFEIYKKEKQKLISEQPQTGQFTENYDASKIKDITNTIIRKKRPRSPSHVETMMEKNEDIKKDFNNNNK